MVRGRNILFPFFLRLFNSFKCLNQYSLGLWTRLFCYSATVIRHSYKIIFLFFFCRIGIGIWRKFKPHPSLDVNIFFYSVAITEALCLLIRADDTQAVNLTDLIRAVCCHPRKSGSFRRFARSISTKSFVTLFYSFSNPII